MGEQGTLGRLLPVIVPVARSMLALAAVALMGAWIGYYLITPWPGIALKVFRATIALHLVTGAVLIPYLVSLVIRRRLPGGGILDIPVLAGLAAYFLATAASENWRVSLENCLLLLAAASIFFVLSDGGLFRRWQVEAAVLLASLGGAVRALWIVGDKYLEWLRLSRAVQGGISFADLIPPTVPRVTDVGDHANLLGMALAMALPFFIVAVFRRGRPAVRIFGLLGTPVMALALFLTLSRGAWLGAAAATGVTLIGSAVLIPGARETFRRLWDRLPPLGRRLGLPVSAGLLVLAAAGVILVFASSSGRPLWLFRESGSTRWDVMTVGAEIVRDYPVLGAGPDTFGLLYPEYSGENPRFHFHSHNGFLQTAVDAGIPGVLAMALLVGALAWMLVRAIPSASPDTRLTLIAVGAGLTAFAVHSMVDAPNTSKSVLAVLAAVGATGFLASREAEREDSLDEPEPLLVSAARMAHMGGRCVIPLAMAALLVTWARVDLGHYYFSSALANANNRNWSQALEQAERSVELDPEFAIHRLQLGTIHGQVFLETRDVTQLSEAMAQFRRVLELEPRSAIAHANLALLNAEVAEGQAAREEALAALEVNNGDPAVVMVAGAALEKSSSLQAAIEAYGLAISLDSSLADSPYWSGTPFRADRFADIIRQSNLSYNPCEQLRLIPDGSAGPASRDDLFSRCAARVLAKPTDLRGRLSLAEAKLDESEAYMAEGASQEASAALANAKEHVDYVLARQPDNGWARTLLGRWYAARDDVDAARAEWLRAGELHQVEALILLGDSYLPGEVPGSVARKLWTEMNSVKSEVQFHLIGILYYRRSFYRESPWTILLPGEWQAAVPGDLARAEDALDRWSRASATSR